MSRKEASFAQLISYIERGASQPSWRIRHNLFARDPDAIRTEFEQNADLLARRKNGVFLYHEIISITRAEGVSEELQKAGLREIAERYIAERCPENLVFGNLHDDKGHSLHYHLLISSNAAWESKRLRLPKSRFREIQVQLERYVLEAMPELKQRAVIAREHERDAAQEEALQNTPEGVLAGDSVAERVARALSHSADRASLRRRLEAEGLELYIRGQTPGVIEHHSGKKHRLKTLGLALWNAFEALPEEQLSQMVEMSEFAGENEKGAVNEALQDTERHQAPEPERTDTQALWEAELKELRARHEQERQSEAGKSTALLRELKALVRFAVSDTLRGIRSRALKMLERLNIKPKHYEHERRRRDPQHQRGR